MSAIFLPFMKGFVLVPQTSKDLRPEGEHNLNKIGCRLKVISDISVHLDFGGCHGNGLLDIAFSFIILSLHLLRLPLPLSWH